MPDYTRVPVLATAKRAFGLLWDHRRLHAKAIWPPIVFLVTAEFLFHKVVGDAQGIIQIWQPLAHVAWYWLTAIVVLWLAGLKFLLSFSISWRRHILLGDKFDPFFFKRPFWRYLAALIVLYVTGCIWILVPFLISFWKLNVWMMVAFQVRWEVVTNHCGH